MNTHIAIPAHVGEDGVWIEFTSPTTGKKAAVHIQKLIGEGDIGSASITEWVVEQQRIHRLHNPLQAGPDLSR